ncbi:EG45-like domain containing protein [Alnus glutinosa]|uniref:EG45-like domain containing protein n=1 Tax=Alnus glutinosa TaxID=3517 RepID=UPI002D791F1F|nr:EG45-like domain containing protein [Alnus glutinosa]
MGANIHQVLLIVGTIICFASVSNAAQGTATFYETPYVPSACNGFEDDGNLIAAASDSIWQNRSACGRYYLVQCIGATNQAPQPCKHTAVEVKIVDYCPPGCRGTINLSKDAFSIIADPRAGRIKVNYTESSNMEKPEKHILRRYGNGKL